MSQLKAKVRTKPQRRAPPVRRQPHHGLAPAILRPSAQKRSAVPEFQAKLKVGAANDEAEKEADRTADQVAAMGPLPAAAPVAPPEEPSEEAQPLRRSALDQPSLEAMDEKPSLPAVQEDIELPPEDDVETEKLDQSDFAEIERGEPEEVEGAGEVPPDAAAASRNDEEDAVIGPEGGEAPEEVAARVESPGSGRPLPKAVRNYMEPRFGADFSAVRIHDRPADRETVRQLGARAFAVKSDIWLGDGERTDDTRLMAHELTHVVQQTGRHKSRLLSVPDQAAKGGTPAEGKTRPGKAVAIQGPEAAPKRPVIRRFLGDAIRSKINSYARHVPGYTLMTVILGKNPITGETVPRTAVNLIGGLLGLYPGGTLLFDRLRESRALENAFEWVKGRLGQLNLTWARIGQAIEKAKELFSLTSPIESIKPAFKPLFNDIVTFVGEIKDKVLEFIVRGALKLAGPLAEKVWGIIKQAGDTLGLILSNPLGFAKNLFLAVGKGFGLFATNILTHLKKGLLGFIFGSLQGLDLELPEKLNLKGIGSLVFQIMGLTWARIREMLVKKLKPDGERKVNFLEKAVDILKVLVTEGVMGIWQKILGMIENLKQTVIGGITQFITVTLVKAGLGWLAGLSNPVGAVVKVILIVYDFIVVFLERMQQILDLAQSIFGSIAAIAKGNVTAAAKKVEEAIGRTVPLILAFLAAMIPVSGIASKIRSIIKKLRKPVDKAIGKLVSFLVKKAKKLLAKIVGKVNKKRKLPSAKFRVGTKTHRILVKKQGNRAAVFVKSRETPVKTVRNDLKTQETRFKKEGVEGEELADVLAFVKAFETASGEVETAAEDYAPNSRRRPQARQVTDINQEAIQAGDLLDKFGFELRDDASVDVNDPTALLRFQTDVTTFEGQYGIYNTLATAKSRHAASDRDKRVLELDHNPSQAILDRTRTHLVDTNAQNRNKPGEILFQPGGGKPEDVENAVFGRLSIRSTQKPAGAFPVMAIYGQHNAAMGGWDAARGQAVASHLAENGLESRKAIKKFKRLIGGEISKKLTQINMKYRNDPTPIKRVIGQSTRTYRRFAEAELNLSNQDGTPSAAATETYLRGTSRNFRFTGGAPDLDFIKNEGRFGTHNSLSGNYTKRNILDADHNPMRSEMKPLFDMTLFNLWSGVSPTNHPNIKQIRQTSKRARVRQKMVEMAKASHLTPEDRRKDEKVGRGGALIVPSTINQHPSMTSPSEAWVTRIRNSGRGAVLSFDHAPVIADLAAGNDGDAQQKYNDLHKRAVQAIHSALKDRIEARQQQIFDLYQRVEAPWVHKVNEDRNKGSGPKAVGLLARIAARGKSSQSTSALLVYARRYFPEP